MRYKLGVFQPAMTSRVGGHDIQSCVEIVTSLPDCSKELRVVGSLLDPLCPLHRVSYQVNPTVFVREV